MTTGKPLSSLDDRILFTQAIMLLLLTWCPQGSRSWQQFRQQHWDGL